MNAPRPFGSRAGRTLAASAGFGLAALLTAPTALADSYNEVAPRPTTEVLGMSETSYTPQVVAAERTPDPSVLAHTGFEAGSVAVAGLGLLVGGALLVRSGRRRAGSAA